MPPDRLEVPWSRPAFDQSEGPWRAWSEIWTATIVEPYMSMTWPGWLTPTDSASTKASTEPTATGVPGRRPVMRAALSVILPATSLDHMSLGIGRSPQMSLTHSSTQSFVNGE